MKRQHLLTFCTAIMLLGLSSCGLASLAPEERPTEPAEQAAESAVPEATPLTETGLDPLEENGAPAFSAAPKGRANRESGFSWPMTSWNP